MSFPELEGHVEGVQNYCISVKEHGEDVIFLRKIVRGGADKSFGIHVARLAGVPHPVLVRAHEIQARLEVSDVNKIGQNILEEGTARENEQVSLFDVGKTEIINELQNLDVMALTPIDAMNKLFLLREKAAKSCKVCAQRRQPWWMQGFSSCLMRSLGKLPQAKWWKGRLRLLRSWWKTVWMPVPRL